MRTRDEYFSWVHRLFQDCLGAIENATVKNDDPEVMQKFTDFMNEKIYEENHSPAQAAVLYVWEFMNPEHRDRGAQLEWGHIGVGLHAAPHCWIRVGADALLGEDGMLADVNQDVIIDPASPGVTPSGLRIHKASPMWAMYHPRARDVAKTGT